MSDEVKTQLRLPPELHAAIKGLAEKDRRSLNAEIVVLLEEAIATRQRTVEEPAASRSVRTL